MMPDQNLPRMAAEPSSTPSALPTMSPTRLTIQDLYTGGRTRLTGLPTALGRPLARVGAAVRSRGAGWKRPWGAGKSAL